MFALILHIYSLAWLSPLVAVLLLAGGAWLAAVTAMLRRPTRVALAREVVAAGGWVCDCGRLRPPGETCAGCGR